MTDPTDEQFVIATLAQLDSVEASATLKRRVAQIPLEHPRSAPLLWPWARSWQGWVALGAFSALGMLVGTWAPSQNPLQATAAAGEGALGDFEPDQSEVASREAFAETQMETAADQQQTFTDQEDPLELTYALALSEQWQGEDPESLWWDEGVEVTQ